MAAPCGIALPDWLGELFEGLDKDPDTRRLIAGSVAAEMCRPGRGGLRRLPFLHPEPRRPGLRHLPGAGLRRAPRRALTLARRSARNHGRVRVEPR